jgi:hypothetical protein
MRLKIPAAMLDKDYFAKEAAHLTLQQGIPPPPSKPAAMAMMALLAQVHIICLPPSSRIE